MNKIMLVFSEELTGAGESCCAARFMAVISAGKEREMH